jgi:hypothetical protein
MMKNKGRIIGTGLLALSLAFTSCSNPLGEKPEVSSSEEVVSGGRLVIQLGGLDARTLGPEVEEGTLQYRLVIEKSGGNTIKEGSVDFTEVVERFIEPGSYSTIGVGSYTTDNKAVGWGKEQNVNIVAGETKSLLITLLPVTTEDVAGIFEYDIDFPESRGDFDYASTSLMLNPAASSTNSASPGISINLRDKNKDAAQLQLPAGKYTLDITLESTRQINGKLLQVVRKETVYIYPNLTTKASYTITEADFGAQVYLKGTATVNNNTGHTYIPTVNIKFYDPDEYDVTNGETVSITGNSWEWLGLSEKLGGPGNLEDVNLQFTVKSNESTPHTFSKPAETYYVDKQGNTGINLNMDIYSIVKDNGKPGFDSITGVSGIAYNSDAIPNTEVSLKINPASGYGIIRDSVKFKYNYYGEWEITPMWTRQEGVVTFSMPSSPVTISADFFHLAGTVSWQNLPEGYTVTRIEAHGNIGDQTGSSSGNTRIGSTTTITNGTWTIPVSANTYINDYEPINFTVYAANSTETIQRSTQTSVNSLVGSERATLTVVQ